MLSKLFKGALTTNRKDARPLAPAAPLAPAPHAQAAYPLPVILPPAAPGCPAMVASPAGPLMVDAADPVLAARWLTQGAYGPLQLQNLETMARTTAAGAVALDIGADIGVCSLVLARAVGAAGTVHAFEARRSAFNMLAGNLALNGAGNVVCHYMAVGAAAGTADPARGPAAPVSIDALDLPRVDFIRIDAAAAPADVLAGARKTVQRDRPMLDVGHPPAGPDGLGRALIEAGYVPYDAGGHFLCWPREHTKRAEMMHANPPWTPAAPATPGLTGTPSGASAAAIPGAAPAATAGSFLEHYDRNFSPLLEHRAPGFRIIFERLEALCRARPPGSPPALIVETGSLRKVGNWRGDGQSTVLWMEFGRFYPCEIHTVDLDPYAAQAVREACGDAVHAHTADSVAYLYQFARQQQRQIDLLYMDSYDVDLQDPFPSAFHHIKELIAAAPCLGPGTIVGIDDNFIDPVGNITGKGYLALQWFKHMDIPRLHDGYQFVWQI
jgi:hypothetical protein